MGKLVPFRKYNRGPFPGLTNPVITRRITKKNGEGEEIEDERPDTYINVDKTPEENQISKKDKTKILAKVLSLVVKEVMENHLYQFNGTVYKQKDGGAIGLRLTGIVARLVMDRWADRTIKLLLENDIKCTY